MKKLIPTLAVITLLTGCYVSTANLTDVMSCTEITDNLCTEDITSFSPDTPEIYVSAILNNAPEGTLTTFSWRYLEDNYDIDSITLESIDTTTTLQSSLSIPDNGWPLGEYEVILSLESDNSEPISKKFIVE